MLQDEQWMRAALDEARHSWREVTGQPSDIPVGAVCVQRGQIIGRGHNRRECDGDPTAHAEVLAIREAAAALGSWRLEGVTLYVTLEPCPMCAGAIWLARVPRLVYGAREPKTGAVGSLWDIPRDPRLNFRPQVRGGVLEVECADLLQSFFSARRSVQHGGGALSPERAFPSQG